MTAWDEGLDVLPNCRGISAYGGCSRSGSADRVKKPRGQRINTLTSCPQSCLKTGIMKHPLSERNSGDSSEMCFGGESRLKFSEYVCTLGGLDAYVGHHPRRKCLVVVDSGCVPILQRLNIIYTLCCRGAGTQDPCYWQAAHGKEASRAPQGWAEWEPSTSHSYNCSWKIKWNELKNKQSSFVGTSSAFWEVTLRWDGCTSDKIRGEPWCCCGREQEAEGYKEKPVCGRSLLRATHDLQSLRDRAPWCVGANIALC